MIVVDTRDPEFGLTIAAIPITIIILFMAGVWTRRESKAGMGAIIVGRKRKLFAMTLINIITVPLLCGSCLLYFQTCSNVPWS